MDKKNITVENFADEIIEEKNRLAYPVSVGDAPIRLVDKALEIEKADQSVKNGVHQKLDVILDQIRYLQKKAKEIIEKGEADMQMHRIRCNFEKKPGDLVYLYERTKDGGDNEKISRNSSENSLYFSRLSPRDWNGNPVDQYLGAYRVKNDLSYECLNERDND